jgi:hypothetical protein
MITWLIRSVYFISIYNIRTKETYLCIRCAQDNKYDNMIKESVYFSSVLYIRTKETHLYIRLRRSIVLMNLPLLVETMHCNQWRSQEIHRAWAKKFIAKKFLRVKTWEAIEHNVTSFTKAIRAVFEGGCKQLCWAGPPDFGAQMSFFF